MKREKHPEKVEQGGGGEEYLSWPCREDDIEGSGACAMFSGGWRDTFQAEETSSTKALRLVDLGENFGFSFE